MIFIEISGIFMEPSPSTSILHLDGLCYPYGTL